MKTPHKWANEMHAFADGAEIEFLTSSGRWLFIDAPNWHSKTAVFRIKQAVQLPDHTFIVGLHVDEDSVTRYGMDCYNAGVAATLDKL